MIDLLLGLLPTKQFQRKYQDRKLLPQGSVVDRKFAPSFLLQFLNIFGLNYSGSVDPISKIWVSLEKSFPLAELEYMGCQVMMSEEGERPVLIMAGYDWHRH